MEEEEEEKMSVNHYDLYRLEEEEKSIPVWTERVINIIFLRPSKQ